MSLLEQVKQAVEKEKLKPKVICWQVEFFDEDEAQRFEWVESTTPELAMKEVAKQWRRAKVFSAIPSKYSLKEIEKMG